MVWTPPYSHYARYRSLLSQLTGLLLGLLLLPPAQAASLPLDGSFQLLQGPECAVGAVYRAGTTAQYQGKALDVLVEITASDNDIAHVDANNTCLRLADAPEGGRKLLTIKGADQGDNGTNTESWSTDLRLTLVEKNSLLMVPVDRLALTALDLDQAAGVGSSDTDDIYLVAPDALYLDTNTEVTASTVNILAPSGASFTHKLKGSTNQCDNTNDQRCRGSALWLNTSAIELRIENDLGASERDIQLSLDIGDMAAMDLGFDYGDAPASYGSAVSAIDPNLLLGDGLPPDAEPAAQSSSDARGDDDDTATGVDFDDEAGVIFCGVPPDQYVFSNGEPCDIGVTVYGNGIVNGWFDWNGDGDFADAGEHAIENAAVVSGQNTLSIRVPETIISGTSFSRFRLCATGQTCGQPSGGPVPGETEDYRIALQQRPTVYNLDKTIALGGQGTALDIPAPSDADGDPLTIQVYRLPTLGQVLLSDGTALALGQVLTTAELTALRFNAPTSLPDTPLVFQYSVTDGTTTLLGTVTLRFPGMAQDDTTPLEEGDTDHDGIPNDQDIDDDNDGILDSVEQAGVADFDGDGQLNRVDLDADNDGISDLEESGLLEAMQSLWDLDGDGRIDAGDAVGSNGLLDALETVADSGMPDYDQDGATVADSPRDHDGDTHPDFLDLDSDNDGVPDVIEAGFGDLDFNARVDAPSLLTNDPRSTDPDGIADYLDLDSDNDGIADLLEAGGTDSDQDARVDAFMDTGQLAGSQVDGLHDRYQPAPLPVPDTDADGVRDFRDHDSDNDGLTDLYEAGGVDATFDGWVDTFVDSNRDGWADAVTVALGGQPLPMFNSDGRGQPDYQDGDSDDDGFGDLIESGGEDSDFDDRLDDWADDDHDGVPNNVDVDLTGGEDLDHDSVVDSADATFQVTAADLDGDGVIDAQDIDYDGDGQLDVLDGAGVRERDADGNGVPDYRERADRLTTGLQGFGGGALDLFWCLLPAWRWAYKRRRLGIILIGMLCASQFSQAANSPADREFNRRLYVGAGIGGAHIKPDTNQTGYTVGREVDVAGSAHLGYDLSKHWTAEMYVADLGQARIDRKGSGRHAGDVGYRHYGASLLAYFLNRYTGGRNSAYQTFGDEGAYLREGFSAYARLGIGVMRNQSDLPYEQLNHTHAHVGLGLEYGWENGLAARAEVIAYDADAWTAIVSMLKRFGYADPYTDSPAELFPQAEPLAARSVPTSVSEPPLPSRSATSGSAGEKRPRPGSAPVMIFLPIIHFEVNSAALSKEAQEKLMILADTLLKYPYLELLIQGHTDATASPDYNLMLSLKRAAAVKKFLVQNGISPLRLRTAAMSEYKPAAKNQSAQGRAMNRRVEFTIYGGK